MDDLMRLQVRLFLFKQWFGGQDMFAVFGQLRKSQRDTGGVTWANMSAFKPLFVPAQAAYSVNSPLVQPEEVAGDRPVRLLE